MTPTLPGHPGEPDAITLPTARAADLPAIMELERAGFEPGEQWSERSWAAELVADGRLVRLARAHRLLGVISLQRNGSEAELMRLIVSPAARRQGIGAALVRAGVETLAAGGVRSVILEVRWDNEAAIELYQRLGFEQLAARENYYAPGVHALIMKLWNVDDLGRGWRPDWTDDSSQESTQESIQESAQDSSQDGSRS